MFKKFEHLIGIPFIDGKSDCWWIVREGHKVFGVEIPDYNLACAAVEAVSYDPKGIGSVVSEMMQTQLVDWEELDKPKEPCVIAMSLGMPGFFHHLALYIGNGRMLHTRRETYSCIERLDHLLYAQREKVFYKYVG